VIDAVVVGAGPNGLAAAVTLAQHGLGVTVFEAADRIGGGARTEDLMFPGVRHDLCSAVHPLGVISPFLRSLDLERRGLAWRWAPVDLAHPLDGGDAGVMVRSIEQTAAGLGPDGPAWCRVFGPSVRHLDDLAGEIFRPLLHLPRHPLTLGRFGLRALQPATVLGQRFQGEVARALFAGVAAHACQPLERATTSAAGVLLVAAGHHLGWPVAEGGSQSIVDALAALLGALGGQIQTGTPVTALRELPPSRVVLLDVAPGSAARLAADRIPLRVQRAYRCWRHGPPVFKVDLVVDAGVPWTAEACRQAVTVHCAGRLEEIAAVEREVHAGRMPDRPFVVVAQPWVADPGRANGDLRPIWAYAHVPRGYTGDASDAIIRQIERFAPGVRDHLVAGSARGPAQLEQYNANYIGGDIAAGANDPVQTVIRPRLAVDAYSTGSPGLFLCSAATPPGAGVHGMCGFNAAMSALRFLARGPR
jgi:phytoene dehydrogenase-like protein